MTDQSEGRDGTKKQEAATRCSMISTPVKAGPTRFPVVGNGNTGF
ncbi:hypothetical protein HNQ50_004002 [Silvimonas terrae]|uniref:Uncharacterized protein n=1 Tax=Silvimonas terrae TaxID=300266 RepID=A0A840RL50_9NEIS|nr:hypothetical protein [Silvimonas terrae]